jgi:hypothetical protein
MVNSEHKIGNARIHATFFIPPPRFSAVLTLGAADAKAKRPCSLPWKISGSPRVGADIVTGLGARARPKVEMATDILGKAEEILE